MDIPVNVNTPNQLDNLFRSIQNCPDHRILTILEKLVDNHTILCQTIQAMVVETIEDQDEVPE